MARTLVPRSGARAALGAGLVLAASLAACGGPEGRGGDAGREGRGAPPESQSTAQGPGDRHPSAPLDTVPFPDTAREARSPWPADTFDVGVPRWSFEVPPKELAKIPSCSDRAPVITGDSVGPLSAGRTRAQLLARCPAPHYGWYYTDDQRWSPVGMLRLGPSLAVVEFEGTDRSSRITRIAVLDRQAATPEGVRAGATLATARETLGDPVLVGAKCAVYVRWPDRPGLVARLVLPDETGWECSAMRALVEYGSLRRVPEGTIIGFLAHVAPGSR